MRLSSSAPSVACTLHRREVPAFAAPAALNKVFARLSGAAILGGPDAPGDESRYSYWTAQPLDVIEIPPDSADPFAMLDAALARYSCDPADQPGPFPGGWIAWFSYDLGRHIERIPAIALDDMQMPLARLAFHDRILCYDSLRRTFLLLAVQIDGDDIEPKFVWLARKLEEASAIDVPLPANVRLENIDPAALDANMTPDQYFAAFDRVTRHIFDGDIYQINLSRRFQRPFTAGPIDVFQWLCAFNPCPYAAYIAGDFTVVSSSMELFIAVTGRDILTSPIKGTRRRLNSDDPAARLANIAAAEELLASPKEQAELNMIIDLERNDLGRVCEYGSISVRQPRHIRTYPTVFHALATVGGTLRPDVAFTDLLRAMFPGGSITGAPKIRAMQIIEQLEPTRRGLYTGSIGYIGLDGNVSLNIAIRTIIIARNRAWAQSGGGLVADSVSRDEYTEILTKARAMAAALHAADPANSAHKEKHG